MSRATPGAALGTAPMTFTLAFPPQGNIGSDRTEYIVHPAFQMTLADGTLSILDPIDDVHFTHQADFDVVCADDQPLACGAKSGASDGCSPNATFTQTIARQQGCVSTLPK